MVKTLRYNDFNDSIKSFGIKDIDCESAGHAMHLTPPPKKKNILC